MNEWKIFPTAVSRDVKRALELAFHRDTATVRENTPSVVPLLRGDAPFFLVIPFVVLVCSCYLLANRAGAALLSYVQETRFWLQVTVMSRHFPINIRDAVNIKFQANSCHTNAKHEVTILYIRKPQIFVKVPYFSHEMLCENNS